ncbi:MAG: metallophosphoesterase [Solirubrobacterales bacterium]
MMKLPNKPIILLIFVITLGFFCFWQNNSIVTSEFVYVNSKIPSEFSGYKIVHISDLHNKEFGKDQKDILNKIKSESPDIIIITGDLIDRRKYDLDTAMTFISGAIKIAPVFYVSGNHEAWSGEFSLIKERLRIEGVHVLDNEEFEIIKETGKIKLLGLSDPAFLTDNYMESKDYSKLNIQLKGWAKEDSFKILLSHRPELFNMYLKNNIDLIFSGHAHGGQIRIPFLGGIFAPDQGLFPKYTSGSYNKDATTMFVSRGLGNSIAPVRIFNRPEIIVVTLKK